MGVRPGVYYSQEITEKISIIPSNQSGVHSVHVYEVRPRRDKRGVDLISDVLPFGRLWYGEPNAISNAMSYAKFFSRSLDAVIRVYDDPGNVIETHKHAGDFKVCEARQNKKPPRGEVWRLIVKC